MKKTKSKPETEPQLEAGASFVWMFKPQFAGLVERGEKLQTVRPPPKRMPKSGDKISLGNILKAADLAMYQSKVAGGNSISLDWYEYGSLFILSLP